jgi:dolichol-phosphate mannosyltransferase
VIVWIVLPAYNEAPNLAALFDGLRALREEPHAIEPRVILVDDGSTDGTPETALAVAGSLPVDVIRNPRNLGLAETFTRGMAAAAERAGLGDVVVCMDADNSHVPGQILRMVREIREGRDVVIASRYRAGAVVRGVPPLRRVLSRGMSWLFRVVLPIEGVRDYSCGYRAYRAEFLQQAIAMQARAPVVANGFACMVAMLIHLDRANAVFGEVPLVLRYDLKQGASKMKIARTVRDTLGVLVTERLRRR